MGRSGLALALTLALAAPALGYAAAGWLRPTAAPSPSRPGEKGAVAREPGRGAGEPVFVGASRAVIAAAMDDTAGLPMHEAMVRLARQWLGRGYSAFPLDRGAREQLRLDLTRFDYALFVEQLLAAVHSRLPEPGRTPQQRFADHVRRLRYSDARVSFCTRQHYFSRWAEAAERQGYLVNLTPHLPGARVRQRPLTFVSSHASAYEPLRDPEQRRCIEQLERRLTVRQAYLPLADLAAALPSLRSGDLYALVSDGDGLDVSDAGVLELREGRLSAIHAAPGQGVVSSPDLAAHAAALPGVVGVAFYRPVPRTPPGSEAVP